jgi:Tfp pilus assembly protein PilN
MQVESLLPLPPELIEVAWRTLPSTNGKMDITMAAARCDHLERFLDGVRDFRPRHILLSCEGMTQAWQSLFGEQERQAAVVSIGERHTQICHVQSGRVVHAAVLDMGMNKLTAADGGADPTETTEATERFAQDMRTILDSFGWEASALWPIVILSDGGDQIDRVVASLNGAGLLARTSLPSIPDMKAPPNFEMGDIYRYRTPLGLALLAMKEPSERLDLFRGLLQEQPETSARRARYLILIAAAVAAFMLVALVVTSYAVDKSRDSHYKRLLAQTDLGKARQRQELLKTVAQARPDLLQLLTDINSGQNSGIVLDSLQFKKGQPVSLTGQADNEEQLWNFQKNLRGRKGIDGAEISNVSQDTKTKKVRFTITFHYKNYTKKVAAPKAQ